jgi:hypothetical protein
MFFHWRVVYWREEICMCLKRKGEWEQFEWNRAWSKSWMITASLFRGLQEHKRSRNWVTESSRKKNRVASIDSGSFVFMGKSETKLFAVFPNRLPNALQFFRICFSEFGSDVSTDWDWPVSTRFRFSCKIFQLSRIRRKRSLSTVWGRTHNWLLLNKELRQTFVSMLVRKGICNGKITALVCYLLSREFSWNWFSCL